MYCTRCGKEIDYEATICKECECELLMEEKARKEAKEAEVVMVDYVSREPKGKVTDGLGKAIAASIVGGVGFIFSYMALIFVDLAIIDYYTYESLVGIAVFLSMLSIGAGIVSLIFGIKSIKFFINAKNQGRVKPIPTLVLGIAAVSLSPMTLLLGVIAFLAAALI